MSYYNELRKVNQTYHQEAKRRKKAQQVADAGRTTEHDPFEKLIVEGRACQLHKDTTRQAAASVQAALVPCHGRRDVLIDRYDGRALLEHIPPETPEDNSDVHAPEQGDPKLDTFLNYERYRDIVQAARRGVEPKAVLKTVAYDVRLRLQRGFGSDTADEVQKREEKAEKERTREAVKQEKRRKDEALAAAIAAAAAGVSGHYGPSPGSAAIGYDYGGAVVSQQPELDNEESDESEDEQPDVLRPDEVDKQAEEFGIKGLEGTGGYAFSQLMRYEQQHKILVDTQGEANAAMEKGRKVRARSVERDHSASSSDSDHGNKASYREFKDPTGADAAAAESDNDSVQGGGGGGEGVNFFTGFDVVASARDKPGKGSAAAAEGLSHMELLDGFFPSLATAVREEDARAKKKAQRRKEAQERREMQQWRSRRQHSRSHSRERVRRGSTAEQDEDEPLPEPPPDPKKSAASASAQAAAAGKKLTPAELVKLRMRHMMNAAIQKDKHTVRRKKDAAAREAELEAQARRASVLAAAEVRRAARKAAEEEAAARDRSRSASMSISPSPPPARHRTPPPLPPLEEGEVRGKGVTERDVKRPVPSGSPRGDSRRRDSDRGSSRRRSRSRSNGSAKQRSGGRRSSSPAKGGRRRSRSKSRSRSSRRRSKSPPLYAGRRRRSPTRSRSRSRTRRGSEASSRRGGGAGRRRSRSSSRLRRRRGSRSRDRSRERSRDRSYRRTEARRRSSRSRSRGRGGGRR